MVEYWIYLTGRFGGVQAEISGCEVNTASIKIESLECIC